MEHPPTPYIAPEPPQFPAPPHFPGPPRSVDLSPLEFVLALIAIITIPALIYTFFFSIKCPPAPFRRRHRRDVDSSDVLSVNNENNPTSADAKEVVADVKYKKETHVKEIGSECPVCLSVFNDGEDVKQLRLLLVLVSEVIMDLVLCLLPEIPIFNKVCLMLLVWFDRY
ncbi:hypothetical protein K2173_002022 [Erythroxylum novogranatense]|uniref:Uncharacterized protein n=1 Tax=Erythroxylum novogranatense TaxID=1862640 RepID=A0AAV8SQD6_9ROSI|nr:hypothetical protein K2173_002022 [Erythroxylum novogranatense]